MLCNASTIYYCCCYYFYQPLPRTSIDSPVCIFLLSKTAAPTQLSLLLPPIISYLTANDMDSLSDYLSFLFYSITTPIPNLLFPSFSLNNSVIVISEYSYSGRSFNRINQKHQSFLADCISVLFDYLSVSSIVSIIELLLLEEKVIVVSNQLSLLPVLLEAILLLLPYAWPHAFIPLIPYYLLPILIDSPSPFLFGTSLSTFAIVKDHLPDDIHVIYLREDCVKSLFLMPPSPKRWL